MEKGSSEQQQCQRRDLKEHEQRWKDKETHGYLKRMSEQDAFVDEKKQMDGSILKLHHMLKVYIYCCHARIGAEYQGDTKEKREGHAEETSNECEM